MAKQISLSMLLFALCACAIFTPAEDASRLPTDAEVDQYNALVEAEERISAALKHRSVPISLHACVAWCGISRKHQIFTESNYGTSCGSTDGPLSSSSKSKALPYPVLFYRSWR